MTDYSELVKALRCKRDDCEGCDLAFFDNDEGWMCQYAAKDDDAAAAIEELQQIAYHHEQTAKDYWKEACEYKAQMPKLGEWQKAKPKGVVTYSDGYAECSNCHETIWLGWGMNFCPHCGTQNKIIDPDDYDGAKMNESNASNALNNAQDGPIITPCRGCSDYDGYGGCKSKGGCARAKMEVQDGQK